MTLNEGAETMAQNGGHGHRPADRAASTDEEQRDVLYFALFPNLLVSLHPDYVMVHTLWPRGPGAPRSSASGTSSPRRSRAPDFDAVRRGRLLGHGQPPGLGGLRARPARDRLARARPRPLHRHRDDRPRLRPARGRRRTWRHDRPVRSRADPRRGGRADRHATGSTRVRIARIAMDARVSTALVHYHFATREALLAEALEHSYETAGVVTRAERRPGHAPEGDDRPVPAAARRARARLGAVGRAVAARGPPSRAAAHRREALRAHERRGSAP